MKNYSALVYASLLLLYHTHTVYTADAGASAGAGTAAQAPTTTEATALTPKKIYEISWACVQDAVTLGLHATNLYYPDHTKDNDEKEPITPLEYQSTLFKEIAKSPEEGIRMLTTAHPLDSSCHIHIPASIAEGSIAILYARAIMNYYDFTNARADKNTQKMIFYGIIGDVLIKEMQNKIKIIQATSPHPSSPLSADTAKSSSRILSTAAIASQASPTSINPVMPDLIPISPRAGEKRTRTVAQLGDTAVRRSERITAKHPKLA